MATIITNRRLIDPPPRQRPRYGLFNAATVLDMPDRVIGAGLQFFADDCGDNTQVYNQTCDTSPVKTINEGSETVETDPFWLVTRKQCGTVGRTAQEIKAATRAQLDASEQREVEAVLWTGAPGQPNVLNLIGNVGTTTVVPTAPGAGAALSALEEAYYSVNGYVGTIHINMAAEGALEYAGFLNPEAGVLRTRVGSSVSLGSGYDITGPAGVAPAAGFVWAFMTGYTTVWRSTDAQIPQPDPVRSSFPRTAPVNEVQNISVATGTPTAGTFTLAFDGQTTAPIAFNATAAQVQAALEALTNINPGDVVASGGPLPGTSVDVTFQGQYAGTNVPQMTVDNTNVIGGTYQVTTTTQGVPGGVINQWDVVSERVYAAAWSCPEVFAVQVPVAAPATAATPAVPA